ncbi:MAG: response regulator [Vicinamibacterales bacterium]
METDITKPGMNGTLAPPGARTILVIDDDMSVQMFVTQVLRNAGYHVLAAADMQEALHMSDVYPTNIHLILTDIMLPTSNGMALAQALVAKRPRTPVLYMSGAGANAIHAIQFEGAPVGEFLEKPFAPDALVTRVRAILLETAAEAGATHTGTAASSPEAALRHSSDAIYRLESAVRCPQCGEIISTLQAVRLLRTQVNFTSTLPRRGRVLVCPSCTSIVSAELTSF